MLAIVLVWLVVGLLRAPGAATHYFSDMESPKQVSEVSTSAFPAIPPFWIVQVQGNVTEATGVHYTSAQIVLVEPISGFALTLGSG